jgi:hypothetical protein
MLMYILVFAAGLFSVIVHMDIGLKHRLLKILAEHIFNAKKMLKSDEMKAS